MCQTQMHVKRMYDRQIVFDVLDLINESGLFAFFGGELSKN